MNHDVKKILEICDDFLQIPSVTHFEKPFLVYLQKKAVDLGYETIVEDNYLVVKGKSINPKYLFSSHIDRHGLIKNENGQIEYLAYYFKKKYGLQFKKDYHDFYIQCSLRHTNDYVSSYDLESGKVLNSYKTLRYEQNWKEKLVTFDFDKKSLDIDKVFKFDSKVVVLGDKFLGQIDNVISAAVLFFLLETIEFQNDIIFTTKEEIGRSYLNVLDYMEKYNQNLDIITLDTTPYENFNGKNDGFLVLREGDENGKFNLDLVNNMKDILSQENISFYFKPSDIGMTELGRVSTSSEGKYNGATLQIPTMNYHTTYETSTLSSLYSYYKILKLMNQ